MTDIWRICHSLGRESDAGSEREDLVRGWVDHGASHLVGAGFRAPATHNYKYSLFFGRDGKRLVGFDNERGKGDHKHILGMEMPYAFESIARLLRDFLEDVETVKGTSI